MTQTKTQQLGPQIFTVWSDKLNGRVDPFHYQPEFVKLIDRLKGVKTYKLVDLITDLSGGATPRVTEDFYLSEKGIPFLRVQNITEKGISLDDVKFIKPEVHNTQLKRSQLKKDDIVFTITGRIGSASVVPDNFEGNINQHSVRLHLKDEIDGIKILPQYIATYFNSEIGRKMSLRDITGGTRPALDYEAIRNLQIPLPPLSTQNKIVEIMAKAYQEKKEKQAEAGKLLESVDTYVLDQLGIKAPEIRRDMVFEVMSDEIKDRIDGEYYQKFYKNFIDEVQKCKFPKKRLEDITEFIMNGRTPAKDDYVEDEGVPLIKAGTASGRLVNLEKLGYVNKDFKGKQTAQKGDIFILSAAHQAEYVGKNVSLLDEEPARDTYFVGELINVRANQEICLTEYLFSFLASPFAFVLVNREKRGQTSHIYPDDLKNLIIPVPPLAVQKKIVDKLKSYRIQAQKLKDEANNNLQKAKEKVEQIILG